MKNIIAFLTVIGMLVFAGCADNPADTSPMGDGRIQVEAYDAPLISAIDEINIHVEEVSVHAADSADSNGSWIILAEPDTTYNFLELINGEKALLADTALPSGHYTQLRLKLSGQSHIVIDGQVFELKIPSSAQSGVKINLNFEVNPDELVGVFVDFNASKSIHWTPGLNSYILRPTFSAMNRMSSGTVQGVVQDTVDNGIPQAIVSAVAGTDTTTTVSEESGEYKLILSEDTFTIQAMMGDSLSSDTIYTDVEVNKGDEKSGYDFILLPTSG